MAGALVVVGEAVAARAERERAAGDRDELVVRSAHAAQPRLAVGQQRAEGHALAHGLGVLHLVAQDELVQDRVDAEPGGGLDHARADVLEVSEGVCAAEDLDAAAHRARGLEGVVDLRQLAPEHGLAAVAVHQPQVLESRDVPEIPHQRAHDRVDHALQIVV